MLDKLNSTISNDEELSGSSLRALSLVFLLISGIMSFLQYTATIDWLPDWWTIERTFRPQLISTIIAIFLITPLYLRDILKWNKSIYSILSLVLILLLFSSFVELAIGGNQKSNIMYALLGSSVVLSWLGIKEVAGVSWALALLAGISSAIVSNMAMGFNGFIYIGSGFIGLVLHSGLNPGGLVQAIKKEFSSTTVNISGNIKQDMNATIEKVT